MKKIILFLLYSCFMMSVDAADWAHKNISQAVFARSVEDKMPIDIITEADNNLTKIYFFTNIRHLNGERISHRWIYQGKIKAELSFDIKGERWRIWSSKNLWHKWTGVWSVEVRNQAGEILLSKQFNYTQKP